MPELTPERVDRIATQIKTAFGTREFTGTQVAPVIGLKSHHGTGQLLSSLTRKSVLVQTRHGYRYAGDSTPQETPMALPSEAPAGYVDLPRISSMITIGKGCYLSPSTILLADTMQADKVTLFTAILEISDDTTTKYVRNKKLIFTKQNAPDEYAAVMAWLRANSDTPVSTPDDAQAALQLAEEAQAKLTLAREEIAQLKTKIAQFRKMLE